jgi:quinol monooxygenase YgiN
MTPARAQDSAVYAVTYVEVMPNAVAAGKMLLKRYRDSSREESGNVRSDVLQEIARPNRFAIVDAWNSQAAFDAHEKDRGTLQFLGKLKPIEDAPHDQRVTRLLYAAPAKRAARGSAIYVATHVDVIPPDRDNCMAALKIMSADTANDPGNLGYQVLQQTNRSNHFTVLEAWSGKTALDAHAMAAHTRSFREKFAPLAGALYDERFYRALD